MKMAGVVSGHGGKDECSSADGRGNTIRGCWKLSVTLV